MEWRNKEVVEAPSFYSILGPSQLRLEKKARIQNKYAYDYLKIYKRVTWRYNLKSENVEDILGLLFTGQFVIYL